MDTHRRRDLSGKKLEAARFPKSEWGAVSPFVIVAVQDGFFAGLNFDEESAWVIADEEAGVVAAAQGVLGADAVTGIDPQSVAVMWTNEDE